MKIYSETPIHEPMDIYEAESKYLNQEPNASVYYIPGKIIVRGDGGDLYFTELAEEDKGRFCENEQIEADYLKPVTELSAKDREAIANLEQLNAELEPLGIRAVARETEGNGKDARVFALIAHPDHPENTYFRISIQELHQLTAEQIAELPEYDEERPLDAPYAVQIENGMMLVY